MNIFQFENEIEFFNQYENYSPMVVKHFIANNYNFNKNKVVTVNT